MRQMNLYLPRALMREAGILATAAGKTLPLWIAEAVEAAVIRAQEEAREHGGDGGSGEVRDGGPGHERGDGAGRGPG